MKPTSWIGRLLPVAALIICGLLAAAAVIGFIADEPRRPLVIGVHEGWIGHQPLFLEESRGSAAADSVVLKGLVNVSAAQQGFRSGALDALFGTLDEALRLRADGIDLQIVVLNDCSSGADAVVAQPSIGDVYGLRGARVALMPVGIDAYIVGRALQLHDMSFENIHIVPLEGDNRLDAFKQQIVDAVVTYDPILQKMVDLGGHVIFDTSDIPGESCTVLMAKAETLRDRESSFAEFIKVWARSVRSFHEHRELSIRKIADQRDGSVEDVVFILERLHLFSARESLELLAGADLAFIESANRIQNNMLQLNLLEQPVDVSHLVSPNLLRRLYGATPRTGP